MKKSLTLSFLFALLIITGACNNKNSEKQNAVISKDNPISKNTIHVYYFHGSIRCSTCVAVDENTHQYLKELFPEKMNKGEIVFKSINIDKNKRPDLIKKYQIYGQTLLLIKDKKVIDLTNDAFQFVTTQPETWKGIIASQIEHLTKL